MITLNKVESINRMNYNSVDTKLNQLDWSFEYDLKGADYNSVKTDRIKAIKYRMSVVYFIALVSSILLLLLS